MTERLLCVVLVTQTWGGHDVFLLVNKLVTTPVLLITADILKENIFVNDAQSV